jgi:hypothetical protein
MTTSRRLYIGSLITKKKGTSFQDKHSSEQVLDCFRIHKPAGFLDWSIVRTMSLKPASDYVLEYLNPTLC